MGGRMSFIVREDTGKVHNFYAWTGIENDFLHTFEFNDGNRSKVVKKFIKKMKEYSEGENFYLNGIFPTGYGIVVVDFQKNKIHSFQNYNNPASLNLLDFSPSRKYHDREIPFDYFDFYDEQDKFIGSIKDVLGQDLDEEKLGQIAFNKLCNDPDIEYKNQTYDSRFIYLKPKGLKSFEVIHYNDNSEKENLIQNLKSDGFNITEEDEYEWKNFND